MPAPPASDTLRRLLLHLPTRRRVYEAIVATPGTHVRRMSRELGMALGSVEHHLRQLEKHGLVFTKQVGRRRTYYALGQVDEAEAAFIHALRRPLWATIIVALLESGESGVTPLATRVGLPAPTVSYHLRRMLADGLVDNLRVGRESVYFAREPAMLGRLLEEFRPQDGEGAPHPAFVGLVARARGSCGGDGEVLGRALPVVR